MKKFLNFLFVSIFLFQVHTLYAEEMSGNIYKNEYNEETRYNHSVIETVKGIMEDTSEQVAKYGVKIKRCFDPEEDGSIWIIGKYNKDGEKVGKIGPRKEYPFEKKLAIDLFSGNKETISEPDTKTGLYYSISLVKAINANCNTAKCHHSHKVRKLGDTIGAIIVSTIIGQNDNGRASFLKPAEQFFVATK